MHWHAAYNFFPPNDSATVWPLIENGRHTTGDIGRVEHMEPEGGVRPRWFEWGVSGRTFVEEWVNVDESGGSVYAALRRPAVSTSTRLF